MKYRRGIGRIFFFTLVTVMIGLLACIHIGFFQQDGFFRRWFTEFLIAEAICLVLFAVVLLWTIVREFSRVKQHRTRSLVTYLSATMMITGAIPLVIVYIIFNVSITRSIESWFDKPLRQYFDQGISLGQYLLGQDLNRLELLGRRLVGQLEVTQDVISFALDDIKFTNQLDEVSLFDAAGGIIASSHSDALQPRLLTSAALSNVSLGNVYHTVFEDNGQTYILVALPFRTLAHDGAARILQIIDRVPPSYAERINSLQTGQQHYVSLLALRSGLRTSSYIIVGMTVIMIMLFSCWIAVKFSRYMINPLEQLTAATRKVAEGDLHHRVTERGRGELRYLAQHFNQMITQLRQARAAFEEREVAITQANIFLEQILEHLSLGILIFSADNTLQQANAKAESFLKEAGEDPAKINWNARAAESADDDSPSALLSGIRRLIAAEAEAEQVTFHDRIYLLRHYALLEDRQMIVIDDITTQVRAIREDTWEQAARRFAHEINNPLTPIRLTAERLQTKLIRQVDDAQIREILTRSTDTIINQVDAMGMMVKMFHAYADPPTDPFISLNINALINEMIPLYQSPAYRLTPALAPDLPEIAGNAIALRQLLHNLLKNAQEAIESREDGAIDISTASTTEHVVVSISDNGGGIAPENMKVIFDHSFTTKPHGTGFGLAIVKKIVTDHGGEISITNDEKGLCVTLHLPL